MLELFNELGIGLGLIQINTPKTTPSCTKGHFVSKTIEAEM